ILVELGGLHVIAGCRLGARRLELRADDVLRRPAGAGPMGGEAGGEEQYGEERSRTQDTHAQAVYSSVPPGSSVGGCRPSERRLPRPAPHGSPRPLAVPRESGDLTTPTRRPRAIMCKR